jgi:nicotinate-nucleotide--dimethylbenzimidazole phosphoribosyltransferase
MLAGTHSPSCGLQHSEALPQLYVFAALWHLAGVGDEGLSVKQSVVQAALAVNQGLIQQGPLQALQAVGGLELAAMTGAYLEAARRGMPVIVDGYISGASFQ